MVSVPWLWKAPPQPVVAVLSDYAVADDHSGRDVNVGGSPAQKTGRGVARDDAVSQGQGERAVDAEAAAGTVGGTAILDGHP